MSRNSKLKVVETGGFIHTEKELFAWLYRRVIKSEPQIVVTPGLIELGEVIRDEVAEVGFLARYDFECWDITFECILKGVSEPGKARCGEKLIYWLSTVYGLVAASDPDY